MSYEFITDYKDHISDKTKLVFDLDQICFAAAAAAEEHSVKVVFKKTGKEVFKVEEVSKPNIVDGIVQDYFTVKEKRRFKNISEFWGKGKKVGGYLEGTINTARELKGLSPYSREDFEFEDLYKIMPFGYSKKNADQKISSICRHLGVKNWIGLIDSGNPTNFRLDLPMPLKYKSNREGLRRPEHLAQLKDYFRSSSKSLVIDGMESDDHITMYAVKSYKVYKNKGFIPYIPVSIDKDNQGFLTGGILFNNTKVDDKFKYDAPFIISGLGSIWMKSQSESTATGFMMVARQMLIGDWETDCFSPCKHFGKRYGDKSVYRDLKDCKSIKDAVEVVEKKYNKWFPKGVVEFEDFNGDTKKMTVDEWKEIIFKCLYMKHSENDNTTWSKIVKRVNG